MKIELQFKDYQTALATQVNDPLSLELALLPFNLSTPDTDFSRTLLVGHLLDYLSTHFEADAIIDFLDVAEAATDLGLDGAENFLALAPLSMFQIIRSHLS